MTTAVGFSPKEWIVELVVKYWLPGIYPQDEFVDAGGLMSYGRTSLTSSARGGLRRQDIERR